MQLTSEILKVTAFITRETVNGRELLVFQHPYAGVQLPAGTVDPNEAPETAVAYQKKRFYFWLTCHEESPDRWTIPTDGHLFELFWVPLTPKPYLVQPQMVWLDAVYERIRE
ncbi:MAG: hypothetical protein AAF490_24600 [Chloroflexota bacterium]